MLCWMQHCNNEGHIKIMLYYFASETLKNPFCRALIRVCENHATMISGEHVVIRNQILH